MNFRMLSVGIFLIFASFVSIPVSRAERTIVQNPRTFTPTRMLPSFKIVDFIDFGRNTYLIVETPPGTVVTTSDFKSDRADPDFEIEMMPETVKPLPPDFKAWHVEAMKYSQLPPTATGQGIVVAVIDSGIDIKHPALKNHLWNNPGEIPLNHIDDDGNGFVDDIHGYDFANIKPTDGDTHGHGTHCAGVIVADQKPGGLAQGVAQGAKVMGVGLFGGPIDNKTFLSLAARATKYAVDNGAHILSNSWRLYPSWKDLDPTPEKLALLKDAILYAEKNRVLFITAAGNEMNNVENPADPVFPISFQGLNLLVGVAASEEKSEPAIFTNYGLHSVHVAAPGNMIVSTYPDNQWVPMSGTSMATPLVAGVLARALSAGAMPDEVMQTLIRTSDADSSGKWNGKMQATGPINPLQFLSRF